MVILLGASGYVGSAFESALRRRSIPFLSLSRKELDYTNFVRLLELLKDKKPAFLINAAGFTGKPNVDACENAKAETLLGNAHFPQTLAQACQVTGIPWGHVSSGCIYSGAKIRRGNEWFAEKNMNRPELRRMAESQPEAIAGYTENDPPNFSFRDPPCSFYSGTKALAEEILAGFKSVYLWRLRIPFDESDHPRNFLTKIQSYPKVYDNLNSLSHRGDFVEACLDLWEGKAPFGAYNVTNPGFVSTRQVVKTMKETRPLERDFEFWESDEAFYRISGRTPRSNCILDTKKLLKAGVKMRPVMEALQSSFRDWKPMALSPA